MEVCPPLIMGMESYQIAISKSYTNVEWKEDLKKFCRQAGAEGKPCVFLFSDSQIKAGRLLRTSTRPT